MEKTQESFIEIIQWNNDFLKYFSGVFLPEVDVQHTLIWQIN